MVTRPKTKENNRQRSSQQLWNASFELLVAEMARWVVECKDMLSRGAFKGMNRTQRAEFFARNPYNRLEEALKEPRSSSPRRRAIRTGTVAATGIGAAVIGVPTKVVGAAAVVGLGAGGEALRRRRKEARGFPHQLLRTLNLAARHREADLYRQSDMVPDTASGGVSRNVLSRARWQSDCARDGFRKAVREASHPQEVSDIAEWRNEALSEPVSAAIDVLVKGLHFERDSGPAPLTLIQ